jgi:Uma2 family endonuclease
MTTARITTPIPRLREGDRLTSREFLRRYEADPNVVRAELINGVVYINARRTIIDGQETIMPPISGGGHAGPQARLIGLLSQYSAFTPSVLCDGPITVVLPSGARVVEPDTVLRLAPDVGGQSALGDDDYLHGPPELIVEVANTSAGRDLGPKLDAYQADGVKEYLVWRTADSVIDWFVLKRKKYVPLTPDTEGRLKSETFPGLWLDVPALLAGDMVRVLQVVQEGIASAEHAAFVAKLQAATSRRKRR